MTDDGASQSHGPLFKQIGAISVLNEKGVAVKFPPWPRRRGANAALSDPNWNPLEAIAWIATRDLAIVSGIRDAVAHYSRFGKDGGKATHLFLSNDVADHYCTCGQERHRCDCLVLARIELEQSAERSDVRSTGHSPGDVARRNIPPEDYISSELWHGDSGALYRRINGEIRLAWSEVRFSSPDVLRVWPDTSSLLREPMKPRRSPGASALAAWARQNVGININAIEPKMLAEHWPDESCRPSRDDARAALHKAKEEAGIPIKRGRPQRNS